MKKYYIVDYENFEDLEYNLLCELVVVDGGNTPYIMNPYGYRAYLSESMDDITLKFQYYLEELTEDGRLKFFNAIDNILTVL